MTIDAGLKSRVQTTLNAVAARSNKIITADERLYELSLLASLIRELQNAGATVSLRDSQGQPTSKFVVRNQGASFPSTPNSTSDPGYIEVTPSASSLPHTCEFHNRLFVKGISGEAHEADLVLVDSGNSPRHKGGNADTPMFIAELKYSDQGSKRVRTANSKSLGREMIGLVYETQPQVLALVSVQPPNTAIDTLFSGHLRGGYKRRQYGDVKNTMTMDSCAASVVSLL